MCEVVKDGELKIKIFRFIIQNWILYITKFLINMIS